MTPKLEDSIIQQTVEAVREAGSVSAAAKKLNISRSTLQHRMRIAEKKGMVSKGEDNPVVAKKMAGRSLADFRATYDKSYIVPQRVKAALAVLATNGDEDCWRYESEFVKLAGVSIIDLGNVRPQFADHVVVLEKRGDSSKRIWCGTKAVTNKIKEMLS